MKQSDDLITYFASTNHRNRGVPFGIRRADLRSHVYVCGKTGTGKSNLLRIMLAQDIAHQEGCSLLDPHGDLFAEVRRLAPGLSPATPTVLDFTDPANVWTFNPLAGIPAEKRAVAVAGLVDVFKKLWPDDWGPRLEHLLRNVLFTLVENEGSTLGDIPPLLADKEFRAGLVEGIENAATRDFWRDEYARYSPGFRAVVVAPLQNKIGALLTNPLLRRFFTGTGMPLDLDRTMNEGGTLLVNLDKGRIGGGTSAILGSFILSHIALIGLSRSGQPTNERRDHTVYVDEFATFTTEFVANMLSEMRKFRVALVLCAQHLSQMAPVIRDAVFGNVGTLVSFRVGAADATYLAREFAPVFAAEDLTSLPRYHVYLRLLIDGEASRPFSATTIGLVSELPGWPVHESA